MALPSFLSRKSCTRTASGLPFGCHSRPPFLKSPISSFFFVSFSSYPRKQPVARVAERLKDLYLKVDVLKLSVSIRMRRSLSRLAVRLQAVVQLYSATVRG